MKDFFKKIGKALEDVTEGGSTVVVNKPTAKKMGKSPLNNKTYVAEIAEIHQSFASAITKMENDKEIALDAAPDKPSEDERILALKEMGFKANPTIVKHEKAKKNHEDSRKLIENFENKLNWAERYMLKYPNYKFITHDLVVELCNKYGLVIATADKFKEEIPESNVEAMIKFKKEFDHKDACFRGKEADYSRHSYSTDYAMKTPINEHKRQALLDEEAHLSWRKFKYEDTGIYLHGETLEKTFGVSSTSSIHGRGRHDYVGMKGAIRMVANAHMFNVDKWEEFDADTKELTFNRKKWLELDPIMLMPVYTTLDVKEEGYLIITAWGDEASDPDVINEKMN